MAPRPDPAGAPVVYGAAMAGFLRRRRLVLDAFVAAYDQRERAWSDAMRQAYDDRAARLAGVLRGNKVTPCGR